MQRNWCNCNHESELACTDRFQGGGHEIIPENAVLFSMNIWQVYTRHIPGIYMSYLFCRHLAGLPGLPSAPGCLGPGLSADPFLFGYWKSSNPRLGPSKVPQPVVDHLIDMAAPAGCRALTVSTPDLPEFQVEGLLLSSSVLVRNSRCGVSIKKARKE